MGVFYYSSDRPFELHCLFGPSFFHNVPKIDDAYMGGRPII